MNIKIGILSTLVLLVVVALPVDAQTVSAVDRYGGSFIYETTGGNHYYWYVDQESGERYAINRAYDFSRLLTNLGIPIDEKELIGIPLSEEDTQPDYDTVHKHRGELLLVNNNVENAWYVEPLSEHRFRVRNGEEGFKTIRDLALGIPGDQLSSIPVTSKLGFNVIKYTSSPIILGSNLDFESYQLTFDYLRNNHLYRDNFSDADLYFGSIQGMVDATGDINSAFLPPEVNSLQRQSFFGDSSIEGIGAVIESRNNSVYILQVLRDTPAAQAGLEAYDQILRVDDETTEGLDVSEAVAKIKGPSGTFVRLTIYRARTGTEFTIDIKRARVDIPSVESEILDNGKTAYFRFTLFTSALIRDFLKELEQTVTLDTQGIILDLRDNIGGVTSSAAQLVDMWLGEDQAVYSEKRLNLVTEYVANEGRDVPAVPTYILVNGGSASAAEIVTAALQYYKEATVIGTQTYGKGTGQDLLNFADGSGLKYTTFEWLTPDGGSINGVGVTPDIILELQPGFDNQLQYARNLITIGG